MKKVIEGKVDYKTDISFEIDQQVAIKKALANFPGYELMGINGMEIRSQCVSCGDWNFGREPSHKTREGKVYCGSCLTPDEIYPRP